MVCKTGLSGFESYRRLHLATAFSPPDKSSPARASVDIALPFIIIILGFLQRVQTDYSSRRGSLTGSRKKRSAST
jgi:hypothetical protein